MRVRALWLVAALVVSACSTTEDTVAPPNELRAYDRGARIDTEWSQRTGSAFNRRWVRLQPAKLDDRIVTANVNGEIRAWRGDGRKLWDMELGTWLSAGVGAADGRAYVGTIRGELVSINTEDGRVEWRNDLGGELLAPPAPADGYVVARTVDGRIVALDTESGERRWTYRSDVPSLSLRGNSEPLPVRGGVLVGLDNGRLVALHERVGQPLWEVTLQAPAGRSPIERMVDIDGAIGTDRRYVYAATYQGRIARISPERGEITWQRGFSSYAGLKSDGDRLYVSDADSQVLALDPEDGETLWRQEALAHRRLTAPVPIAGTDFLAVADYDGYVHIITRADGRIVARARPGDSFGILADPVPVDDGRLLVQTQGGEIALLRVTAIED